MYVACPRCHQNNYSTATQCAYCGSPLAPTGQTPGFAQTNAPGFSAGSTGGGPGDASGVSSGQPQVGQLIDRKYRVERILGEGGMGVVYVAQDINADQKVVIKSIRPEFANRGDFRERTLAEGKALAKIDHQNVVRFNSIVNSPETNELYIVMQFIDGESLDRTLEKANASGQKLPLPEVIRIFKMALDGVGAAHKEGLMHRDLKPANILVRAKDGVAKVMDFGIAKAEGATKGPTQAGGIVGSLWYMAPEQIKGAKDLDKRLDVYAMGIVLYELVTGVVPFDGETEYDIMTKHMSEPVPSVRGLRPDAPPWIDELIAKATQKDRALRFQSCEEFRAAIDQFDGGIAVPRSMTAFENSIIPETAPMGPVGARTSGMQQQGPGGISSGGISAPTMSAPPKKSSSGVFIAIAAVVLIGGGVGGYFAFAHGDEPAKKPDTTAKNDEKHDDEKHDDKKPDDKKPDDKQPDDKKPDDKKPAKGDPLEALVGDWETDTTNRALKAEKVGDEVVFRVVKPAEWDNAFAADEVRFKLKKGIDATTFEVVDRYRPKPPAGKKYSKTAFGSCIVETSGTVNGKPLEAALKGKTIEVTLATATVQLTYDPGDQSSIDSCKDAKTTGTVKSLLKKK